MHSKVKTIRAVERALEVMSAIQLRRSMSLKELHESTGLPKATLLRILLTLTNGGLVWQRMADRAYVAGALKFRGQAPDITDRLAEISSPILAEQCKQTMWPSVLAVPRLDYMEVIETNGPVVRLDSAVLGPVGLRLSYIHTAIGRAYLAACGTLERETIISRLRPKEPDATGEALLHSLLKKSRDLGYSTRRPHHPWPDRSQYLVRTDRRSSLAVPVLAHGQPVASLNLTWPTSRISLGNVVAMHLATIRSSASGIGKRLEALS